MSATVIIAGALRKYKRIFREARATTPSTAIIPSEHGIRNSILFQRLVRQGVMVPVNRERYYLDENREAELQKEKQKALLIALAAVIIGLIILFLNQKR